MTLISYKYIAALLIFLVSLVAVIYPLKHRAVLKHPESVELGEALASGIFLGAAFFHMLPSAIGTFASLYGSYLYPVPELICVMSFLLLIFLERLSLAQHDLKPKHAIPYIFAIILIIHALTEGAALGVGATLSETLLLFIAILGHKASESFALCVTLLRHALPLRRLGVILLCFALMTPIGILGGTFIYAYTFAEQGQLIAAIFNAFAAGTFLYISTLHHIRFHQHTEETQGLQEFACLALGVTVMGLIAIWA